MRTNIDIDDDIMQAAMRGSEFKTKKDAVEAGLRLLARQAHYREVLKWEGKLHWDDQPDTTLASPYMVSEQRVQYGAPSASRVPAKPAVKATKAKRKTAGVA